MDPTERMKMLDDKKRRLSAKNDEYKELATAQAEAERQHSVAFAQTELKLKLDGTPVTILKDLVKGHPAVAELRFKADVAAAIAKACLESMKDIREAIGADRSILTWLREEKGQG